MEFSSLHDHLFKFNITSDPKYLCGYGPNTADYNYTMRVLSQIIQAQI